MNSNNSNLNPSGYIGPNNNPPRFHPLPWSPNLPTSPKPGDSIKPKPHWKGYDGFK